ncbi:hypothetical protein [Pelistega indica]|nr:hypothetical protein [Pelistega indica]
MVSYSEFVPELKLALGDIPDDIAENYIREAVIAFCERSQVLVRKVEIDVQAGVGDYPIIPEGCEQIISLQRVCVGSHCITDRKILLSFEPCETGCTVHGHSVWFVPPNTLNLRPIPTQDKAKAIIAFVAVSPSRDSCECDRIIYDRYHETVINGALARLYLAKTTPWHDRQLAEYHRTLFGAGVSAAGMDRLTGGVRGPFAMRARRII